MGKSWTMLFLGLFPVIHLVGCAPAASAPRPNGESHPAGLAQPPASTLVVPYAETSETAWPPTPGPRTTDMGPPTGIPSVAPTLPSGTAPIPTRTPDLPVMPDGERAATGLTAEPGCSTDGRSVATLRWTPAISRGVEQRVDVAHRLDGFEIGEYASSAPLLPDEAELVWDGGLEPGLLHAWRVLTRQDDTWASSDAATFSALLCGRDPATPATP